MQKHLSDTTAVPPELEPLAEEARKYSTHAEWQKHISYRDMPSPPVPYSADVFYRGTRPGQRGNAVLGVGIYVTKDLLMAVAFGSDVKRYEIDKSANLLDAKNKTFQIAFNKCYYGSENYGKCMTKEIASQGYDGVIGVDEAEGIVIYDESKLHCLGELIPEEKNAVLGFLIASEARFTEQPSEELQMKIAQARFQQWGFDNSEEFWKVASKEKGHLEG